MTSNSSSPQNIIAHGPLPARVIAGQPEPRWRVPERMARFNVPAVSAAVVDNMELCWAQAWGVLEQGQQAQATVDTLFQTASISKSVTAIGALCLVREGLLSLDAEVNTVLQAWRLPRAGHTGLVTLRRLLSHSAGTSTPGFEGYDADAPLPTLDQMLEGRRPANSPAVEVVVPPGTEFRYSGGGYLVVQKMMEEVTGQSFAEVMRQRVFAPLGMDDSHYAPLDAALHERAASGHVGGVPISGKGPIHVESAAGGLWTTPSDLVRLMAEAMRAYRGKEGPVLGPEVVQEMLTTAFWDFGLGFRVLGEGPALRFSHGGATRGWHGQVHAYPERGQSVAVLTNGANGYVVWPQVERGIARSLGWPGWAPETVQPLVLSATEIKGYTGTYALGDLAFEVRALSLGETAPVVPGIGLYLGDLTWRAVPTGPDVFELLELEGQVLFERAEDGPIAGFEIWFGQPDWSPYRRWRFERC